MDWLGTPDDDGEDRTRRPRPLLFLLASLPWLLVLGLLVLPGRFGPGGADVAPPGVDVDASHPPVTAVESPPDTADPDLSSRDEPVDPAVATAVPPDVAAVPPALAPTGPPDVAAGDLAGWLDMEITELRGYWRVEPGIEEAMALAVIAGRAWLTGIDPVLPVDGLGPEPTDGYAEHLVVEAVEHPARDAAVVTLLAVVLDTRTATLAPSIRRLAVPVAMTRDGPRLAGAPWDLVPPVLDAVTLAREPIEDPDQRQAARAALDTAGLRDHDLVGLYRTSGWPVIAEVRAGGGPATDTAPDADTTREVWLRRHLHGFVVSGTTLAGADPGATDPAATDPTAPTDTAPTRADPTGPVQRPGG